MTITLDCTIREAEIIADLRATLGLAEDADVARVAIYRLARECDRRYLRHTDFAISGNRRRRRDRISA